MPYEAQLHLLRETLQKCRIQTTLADLSLPPKEDFAYICSIFQQMVGELPMSDYIPPVQPSTLYRLTDPLGCRYLYFDLPDIPKPTVLLIGPFMHAVPNEQEIMEWSEAESITPTRQRSLKLFYNSVPLLSEHSHIFILVDAFLEQLWKTSTYQVQDVNFQSADQEPLAIQKASSQQEDTLWHMQNIEQRYAYENALMDAVTKGQIHKADLLFSGFSSFTFEQRTADPVRNTKNYCIIMNTLLRKAAEKGNVHPIHLDSTSSEFAIKIEKIHSLDMAPALMTEIFQTYCRLVRKHAIKDYSPPVQKTLVYIDAHLSDNLTLSALADTLNISSSYLSTLFKKETGQTLTTYINTQRIRQAKHLLETTKLQIQTVAQHCGIMDVQYFSKLFKSITGTTPKQYRQTRH